MIGKKRPNVEQYSEFIIEAYKNGHSLREIADVFKISHISVRRVLLKNKIKLRKRGNRKVKEVD